MEDSLQGPINPCFYGGEYSEERGCSDQEFTSLGFQELEKAYFLTSSLENKMPFLQMLQSVEHLKPKPWEPEEEEEEVSQIEELVNQALCRTTTQMEMAMAPLALAPAPAPVTKERRKRKRSRPSKNKEEVESQRMTHIAVERNRRRQMNDHLNVIKSLIPTSYIQRGDQASIIGGAIDFVKELEQLLESLEAQRKERKLGEEGGGTGGGGCKERRGTAGGGGGEGVCAELKSEVAEIEVTMIQTHVNLKIKCPKRQGQLLKAIVALEDLRLTVLHLNITTSHSQPTATMLYSFNLKIEDECKLGSAEQIAGTVHKIFSFINDGRLVNEAKAKANFRQYSGSR